MVESGPSFRERYANALSKLTPTERKIGDYLIRHPDDVVDASAVQIAAASGSSDATVIRTVQTLGYSGLRELKRELLQDVLRRRSMSATLDHSIDQVLASDKKSVARVLTDSVAVLETFRQEVEQHSVDRAVEIMDRSARIFTYGLGPGGLIASFFALHLNRIGRDARAMAQTGYRIADELLPLAADDCVVLFAPYHQTDEVEVLVDHARAVGAPVILITEALGVSLGERVEVVIRTPATISTLTSEMLVPQALAFAITMQLASQNKSASIGNAELFNQLASTFTGSPGMPSPPFVSMDNLTD